MYELLAFGTMTGFISGFFGVGGGMVLVPMLLFAGFIMKEAVAISIMQMVFSSIYGSFLNSKKAKDVLKDGLIIGIGGFFGGLQSGFIITNFSNETLKYVFIAILFYSIISIFKSPAETNEEERKSSNKFFLFIIGALIGATAMSIGVGGSILLTPLLVRFLNYDLKKATSLSLFFVIFSSIAGFTSLTIHDQMLFKEGATVGLASLIGVYFGIRLKNIIKSTSYKKYILILYLVIFISMIYKVI
ncbi:MAG: sulfite exporter TauE/SafE family protein [Campylobacteraceae bacterium]|nr:sulfite exporter TauE/SafE family protein [Campylobacteraceae bacterium]